MNRRKFLKFITAGAAALSILPKISHSSSRSLITEDKPYDYLGLLIHDSNYLIGGINKKLPGTFNPTIGVPEIHGVLGEKYFYGPKVFISDIDESDFINQYVIASQTIAKCAIQVGAKRIVEISWRQIVDPSIGTWSKWARPAVLFEPI